MTISTRTPEGEPIECLVCGYIGYILASQPPGDSVCPQCGSHQWMEPNGQPKFFPVAKILDALPALIQRIHTVAAASDMPPALSSGLFEILSPQSVVIWVANNRYANSQGLEVIAAAGEQPIAEAERLQLALKAMETRAPISIVTCQQGNGKRWLLTATPWFKVNRDSPHGVIEVTFPHEFSIEIRDAIQRFLSSIAAVAAGSRAHSH